MLFTETALSGAFILTLDPIRDSRGFFARSFCQKEFARHGINFEVVQCNISFNQRKGTLRGLHYQKDPYGESKVVFCRRGAIYDVIVDLRKASPTYGKWISIELSEKNNLALYIPQGFAHGFQTLCDDTELFYLMGNYFHPGVATGVCWNDPSLDIFWPNRSPIMSDNDENLPYFLL